MTNKDGKFFFFIFRRKLDETLSDFYLFSVFGEYAEWIFTFVTTCTLIRKVYLLARTIQVGFALSSLHCWSFVHQAATKAAHTARILGSSLV
jgi:hypothetical protein